MYAPLTILLLLVPAQPPDKPAPDTKAEAEEASAVAKKMTGEYAVQLGSAGKKLKLEPEPVLRWTNHLGRRFYGDVYVWTSDGRPEVIASVNNVFTTKRAAETEIQSLSTGRPVLSHDGKVVWEPDAPGVAFEPLPNAPKPGGTAANRLQQMRALAGQFAVTATYADDKKGEELRLLRAPIFRYASAAQGVTDGGLFAFTKGTDPDALLLIEARGKGDEVRWEYSFARLNGYCALRGTLKDAEVWRVEKQSHAVNTDPKRPYCCLRK
ncbi:Uncharacterized protein OS=Planctomyces maris DSM 8797 GN=PM8797T_23941 PE=4 SV=1 [Gemmata massiliana]|uniref:Uncharacterized protein n=1 Tax=Gemmata massiliana TaxID=1210884 RepID=A0A6P2D4E1_9BACT|nr:hypothetical protein [Gemmata massiliana]VTR96171.1 Uncharacterized protein OS=Planctomyces maris DSM 8797 GN=PM8797T_23941 PE=4 SV=1 [Gemmata massiliana]